ncbi:MAG: hypothetical protein F9K45_09805, partial [Melioribacteraceae bacterium]
MCNITFQNSSGSGSIKVNNTIYSSPASGFQVIETNNINAEALNHSHQYVDFSFLEWKVDGSTVSTNAAVTFSPSVHATYTAVFKGTPQKTPLGTIINSTQYGQPVRLNWTEHPHSGVSKYYIYRGSKFEGNFSNPVNIAVVNRGTNYYIDYDFVIGGSSPNSVA